MKNKPILFSAPMIRALLDGCKRMTRRVVKCEGEPFPSASGAVLDVGPGQSIRELVCPYGQTGDLLWVKENWAQRLDRDHLNGTQLYAAGVREAWYWADGPSKCCNTGCAGAAGRVRTARFMPRWASRITLRVTDVRVQRLQEITEAEALAEGAAPMLVPPDGGSCPHVEGFRVLWDSIHGPESWGRNPWVWVICFETIKANVDHVIQAERMRS